MLEILLKLHLTPKKFIICKCEVFKMTATEEGTLENFSDEELLKISAEILEERAKVFEELAK